MSADYDDLFGPPEAGKPEDAPRGDYLAGAAQPDHTSSAAPGVRNGHAVKLPPIGTPPPAKPPAVRAPPTDQPSRRARHARPSGRLRAGDATEDPAVHVPRAHAPGETSVPLHHRAVDHPELGGNRQVDRSAARRASSVAVTERLTPVTRPKVGPVEVEPPEKVVSRIRWRRWIRAGLSRDENYERALRSRVCRRTHGSYQLVLLGLRGGAGKTALTVALGSVLADVRSDRILAIDADPGAGDLADRMGKQSGASIADLLANTTVAYYNDVRACTRVNSLDLEVLAAQEYSEASRALSREDWLWTVENSSKFYNLVLADCGGDFFGSATQGVLATASGVIVTTSASADGVRQATRALGWLKHNGYQDLLTRACVVINHVAPGRPLVGSAGLVRPFEQLVSADRIVVLPWDRHIADGGEIRLDLLSSPYRRKVLELAAALSDDFERAASR